MVARAPPEKRVLALTLAAVLACAESLTLAGPNDVEGEAVDSLAAYKCCDSDLLTMANMYHAWRQGGHCPF